jgi:AcrR family transcriptional regulator
MTPRSDAQINRDRILQVAHDALAEDTAASLNSIAKRAGVGAGTLYRHFPTRDALLIAVYERDVRRLSDAVGDVLAEHEPLDAFRIWFERLAAYVRIKHGLGEALHTAEAQAVIAESFTPVTAAVATLLRACEAAGAMRPGLDPGDVLLLMSFLWRAASPEQAASTMELAIDGLRQSG